jgi:hypothetical protein
MAAPAWWTEDEVATANEATVSLTTKLLLIVLLIGTAACTGGNYIVYPDCPDSSCSTCARKFR